MRAMLLMNTAQIEDNPLVISELPDPEPAEGQIRLRIRACGICHTDLHTVEGELELPRLPLIPGHQIVGEVDMIGNGVSRFSTGDRVGMPWLGKTCGKCSFCKSDRENLCYDAKFNGLHFNGGYAEYAVADAGFAYPIPEGFEDTAAAPLLCAGIIGYRALRLADVPEGGRLGLFGFGASAHVTIQIARHLGHEVYVFTRSSEHRKHAIELGAKWAGTSKEDPGVKLDSAINFTPAGSIVADALGFMERGGTIACAGIHQTPVPETPYELLYYERTVRNVANFTRRNAEELLKYAAEIPIRTEVQTFALEEANKALEVLKNSEIRGAGVLVVE
ncbi:MAG: zinc-dependent alcohol dehydrogenase family protein [Planctomycetota bacterium]|jgi:propanol-preferring alcohol dehydrogenase